MEPPIIEEIKYYVMCCRNYKSEEILAVASSLEEAREKRQMIEKMLKSPKDTFDYNFRGSIDSIKQTYIVPITFRNGIALTHDETIDDERDGY